MNTKLIIKKLAPLILIITFYILIVYLIQRDIDYFTELIGQKGGSQVLYVLLLTLMTVFLISTIPLVPLASQLWGIPTAAILSLIAWTMGAVIAFSIARRYGIPIVQKFCNPKKIQRIEKLMPQTHVFWGIVLIKLTIPYDLFSYAFGLFTTIPTPLYALAAIIGFAPFAFLLAYLGTLNATTQLLGLTLLIIFIAIWITIHLNWKQKHTKD